MSTSNNKYTTSVVLKQNVLFMWEIVASFSEPFTVLTLESLCRVVRKKIIESSKGTGLMQRYWNVQYLRLLWEEESITPSQRTLDFTFSAKQKNCSWKDMYRDEYPMYIGRIFQGLGADNNSINAAKVLFKVKSANTILSGEELLKLQLTPEEDLAKKIIKKKLKTKGKKNDIVSGGGNFNKSNNNNTNNNDGDGDGCIDEKLHCSSDDSCNIGSSDDSDDKKKKNKVLRKRGFVRDSMLKRKEVNERKRGVLQENAVALTRIDYIYDKSLQNYKGKHKKGGRRKWECTLSDDGET